MKLLNKAILEAFKKQGDTGEKEPEDIRIICKFFNPTGAGTWYCYEYNEVDKVFWCYADLGIPDCAECGTVSLEELETATCAFGLGIERDLHFGKDIRLQDVIDGKRR